MSRVADGIDAAVTFDFHPGDPILAARSEVRALFLLAGWRRFVAGRMPLTLVCVSDPPDTVLSLAESARVTVVKQVPLVLESGAVFDRALGWNVPGGSGRRLVITPEVLVLGAFDRALAGLPANCLSLAPADKAQVPEAAWKAIYGALGLALPATRMPALRVELALAPAGEAGETLPHYHAAVVLAPRAVALGERWVAHLQRLAAVLPKVDGIPPRLGAKLAVNGKVALTTACQAILAEAGIGERRLPRVCDGRPAYFESTAPIPAPGLMHAPNFCGGLADLAQIQEQLRAYAAQLRGTVSFGVRERGGGPLRAGFAAVWKVRAVEAALRRLYLHEVRPTLRRCGAYG